MIFLSSARYHWCKAIREGGDIGVPVMVGDDMITRKAFEEFAAQCHPQHCHAQCKHERRTNCGSHGHNL